MTGLRVAAIDIGTNTVLLTIADRSPTAGSTRELRVIEERHAITRLGQGVDRQRRLDPEAALRTLECLQHYRQEIERFGVQKLLCVGTSALRDAAEGEHFVLEAGRVLGCQVEVVTGAREAELTFRGALSSLDAERGSASAKPTSLRKDELVLAFDVGGGSTEIVLGTRLGEVRTSVSVDVGSVRLFERHGHQAFAQVEGAVRAAIDLAVEGTSPAFDAHPALVIGIAGTMTTLWSVEYGMPFEETRAMTRPLASASVRRLAQGLHAMPLAARRDLLRIDEGRADVIPFGALVASEVLRSFGAAEVRVTGRGVRYGLLLEA